MRKLFLKNEENGQENMGYNKSEKEHRRVGRDKNATIFELLERPHIDEKKIPTSESWEFLQHGEEVEKARRILSVEVQAHSWSASNLERWELPREEPHQALTLPNMLQAQEPTPRYKSPCCTSKNQVKPLFIYF